ncbi:MAG: 4Fe-4S dicluster domain-containing protein [Deltaproteobacteria bacterium]|nr:4Fe-4S dicluster domain-containing protein [Deltaproteobacteria bacterium]
MIWAITRRCRDCLHTACVDVCPVDCIYEYTGDDRQTFPNQLYIHPKECIECGACEPACPWEAVFRVDKVPPAFQDDVALNARVKEDPGAFRPASHTEKPTPADDEVRANHAKWG